MNTKKTVAAEVGITAKATKLARRHANLPAPDNAGRAVKGVGKT